MFPNIENEKLVDICETKNVKFYFVYLFFFNVNSILDVSLLTKINFLLLQKKRKETNFEKYCCIFFHANYISDESFQHLQLFYSFIEKKKIVRFVHLW